MAAGSSHGFFLLSPTFQTCFVQLSLRVLGLMAYWYTGSAFHQIPQSYLIISYIDDYTEALKMKNKKTVSKSLKDLSAFKHAKDTYNLLLGNPF